MASRLMRTAAGTALALGMLAGITGSASAENIGNQGCTPGYWKNHTERWDQPSDYGQNAPEPYNPGMTLYFAFMRSGTSAFGNNQPPTVPAEIWALRTTTMAQALEGGGGSGLTGAARILFRAATAAYLNAAHEGVAYPLRRNVANGIFEQLQSALASGNRQTMLDLAARLDRANNLGCPLN